LLLKHPPFVTDLYQAGYFKLASGGNIADLYLAESDEQGVARALGDLRADLKQVTGLDAKLKTSLDGLAPESVLVGTIGHSPVIDQLITSGKLDVDGVKGKWEAYVIQVVANPLPNVACALVIAGSDRRGTIYGIYELARQIGVSPWYWWADVKPDQRETLIIQSGCYKQGEPSVKYRGIFLNNEAPSLSTWVERFGGFNHKFYEHVFELILRLRGNFLWPAMWSPKSFFRDDDLNQQLAHEYGIVIGTSHHEPMLRSWGEWGRFGSGEWNYSTNRETLLKFWEDGVKWSKDYENIVTLGMRGDGDEPMMHDGTIEEMVEVMEDIITDQRQILSKRVNSDITQIPQVWALYKEVQDLYEAGLKVPEDVTILLGNDNFGNIRMLPQGEERQHPGGFGMYYHFDYVGGPKSYRWVNSTPTQKIWEQMGITYDYGVDRIWVVNVGDLKAHEIATEFFLEMAYDISRWNRDNLGEFSSQWAEREFGPKYAAQIGKITDGYRKFTGRKKPEDVNPETYSLFNYKEAETVLAHYEEITAQAEEIYENLPAEKRDAFFQLVLYPTRASKNVVKLHIYAGLNNLYAAQGRSIANLYADLAEQVFQEEAADTAYYNNELAGGKWRGVMSNPHIGQTGWRTPEKNMMPPVKRIAVETGSEMGIGIEGSKTAIIVEGVAKEGLPNFSSLTPQRHYFDIFNLKGDPFAITITANEPWLKIYQEAENVHLQTRVWVEIKWEQAPKGEEITGSVTVTGAGKTITIPVTATNLDLTELDLKPMTFIESNGYISIEAEHYSKNVMAANRKWEKIANYGRTLSSMAVFPTKGPALEPENAPYLEYQVYLNTPGDLEVLVYTAPTNNLNRQRGLCYGIAFADQPIQIVDTFPKENDAFYTSQLWSRGVMENVRITSTTHSLEPGLHTLRFYMVDPGVVLQKIVIDAGGVRPSYLGPPESYYVGKGTSFDKDGYLQLLTTFDSAKNLLDQAKALPQRLIETRTVLANEGATLVERQLAQAKLLA